MSSRLSFKVHTQVVYEAIESLVQQVIQLKASFQSRGCPDTAAQNEVKRILKELEVTVQMLAEPEAVKHFADQRCVSDIQAMLAKNEAKLQALIDRYS